MLKHLPSSTRTDLRIAVLTGTTIEARGDHLVVRTPTNPVYHWGNFVQVVSGDVDDSAHWLQVFEAEFPQAAHRAIGLPRRPEGASWARDGLKIEVAESLTCRMAPAVTPLAQGYAVRPLLSDLDWGARTAGELAENDLTGEYPADEYRSFMANQVAARRDLVDRQQAAWFGAFTPEGALAASLGIVDLGDCARYQSVLTAVGHRRRGLARHLLSVAAEWGFDRGVEELVIVAEADSAAGRLYTRAGFAPGALDYSAYTQAL
ncbi:GNAT family N-acetyltransferase [Leekyejoonella antrihumi]|uniref:GNAT family N-acetyltransferase n=1 Tax=Leekyejoonella antrihumi TaxID=1660198 RepID=A0A563DXY8_9MICO|nr:GNAT family N-acetyltransferase [Leekyejoonella antrihumi]TWP34989.1 GNAT family N-acetyltransferase [Leekyejoonella antrihumi]